MEQIWHHTFYNELHIIPAHQPLVVSCTEGDRYNDKFLEILFEKFDFPSIFIADPVKLALYSYGRKTGVVINSGHGISSITPIYEDKYTGTETKRQLNIAGQDLTEFLERSLIHRQGLSVGKLDEQVQVARQIKEELCYVAASSSEVDKHSQTVYKRNSAIKNISFGSELYRCPEAMFQPGHLDMNLEGHGLHELVYESVMSCEEGIRGELLSSIVLAGGSTLFRGFTHRLKKEVAMIFPEAAEIKVLAQSQRKNAVWIGGTILASVPDIEQIYVTKEQYDESQNVITKM